MKRITKSDYIYLLKKRKKSRRRIIWGLVSTVPFAFLGTKLAYDFVNQSASFIPESARIYLLRTLFYDFSANELGEILSTTADSSLLPLLLLIYWGYYFLLLIIILGLLAFYFDLFRLMRETFQRRKSLEETLLSTHEVIERIQKYLENPNPFTRSQLRSAISKTYLYSFISPISSDWYTKERFQWFRSDFITKETRGIVFILSKIKDAIRKDLTNFVTLDPYLEIFSSLELFLLSIANRSNKGKFEIIDLNLDSTEEYDLLRKISVSARPIVIKALRLEMQVPKKENKYFIAIKQVLQSFVVKFALSISAIAAIIMMVGVILFRLDTSQAFMTWFTVTFSSLSISIGAASFRQIGKDRKKHDVEE